jgi:hypothetical protein
MPMPAYVISDVTPRNAAAVEVYRERAAASNRETCRRQIL